MSTCVRFANERRSTSEITLIQTFSRRTGRRDQMSEFEHMKPVVTRIYCDDPVILIHGDSTRVGKLTRLVAAQPPRFDAIAGFSGELLHAVVAEFAHDQPLARVFRDAVRQAAVARL